MSASFKPRLEILEDRLAMSAGAPAAIIDGTSNTVLVGAQAPRSPGQLPVLMVIANQDCYAQSPNGSVPGAPSQPASGRISGIAVDPSDSASATQGRGVFTISTSNSGPL
jgi:hypothetical protein